jgi:GT2 family glycosyltransferase
MRLLVCIPVVVNGVVLAECLEQIIHKRHIHVLILDNGATEDVKEVLTKYKEYPQVEVWTQEKNVFVNFAWNMFIQHFLVNDEKHDRLIIMNSDLTLNNDWWEVCKNTWEVRPSAVLTPNVIDDKTQMFSPIKNKVLEDLKYVHDGKGIPGVFITLSRKQAKLVFPLPANRIKIWFGDTIIFETLAAAGYPIYVVKDLLAFHHTSTTVNEISGIHEIIEQDKKEWEESVKLELEEKIKKLKTCAS